MAQLNGCDFKAMVHPILNDISGDARGSPCSIVLSAGSWVVCSWHEPTPIQKHLTSFLTPSDGPQLFVRNDPGIGVTTIAKTQVIIKKSHFWVDLHASKVDCSF
jgi:hypothetical protein